MNEKRSHIRKTGGISQAGEAICPGRDYAYPFVPFMPPSMLPCHPLLQILTWHHFW